MNLIHIRAAEIGLAITLLLLCTPTFSAEPILLKDIVPGSSEYYSGAAGNSDERLYLQPEINNGIFVIHGADHSITELLPRGDISMGVGSLGSIGLFGYNGNRHDSELWRSDGTRNGTYLVKDLNPGAESGGRPERFARWNDEVYFTTSKRKNNLNLAEPDDPANFDAPQLWRTDGTPEGTVLISNLDTLTWFGGDDHAVWGDVVQFESSRDALYFVVWTFDVMHDTSIFTLWRSDGTAEGTAQMVRSPDNVPVPATYLQKSVGGITFFADNQRFQSDIDGTLPPDWGGGELWRTDGSPQGTFVLSDAVAQPTVEIYNQRAYFLTRDEIGTYLARADESATTVETIGLILPTTANDSSVYAHFAVTTTSLYIGIREVGSDPTTHISQLWRYSTADQTLAKVTDLIASPGRLLVKDDLLYFSNGTDDNNELWRSDGTSEGTAQIADLNPTGASFPYLDRIFANQIWFSAYDGTARHLYYSDGTGVGTQPAIRASAIGSQPRHFIGLKNGSTLFKPLANNYFFASRGTPASTIALDFLDDSTCLNCDPTAVVRFGQGALLLNKTTASLWYTDGKNNASGTHVVKQNLWPVADPFDYPIRQNALASLGPNTALFFTFERHADWQSTSPQAYQRKLWRTNGSQSGTRLVKTFLIPEYSGRNDPALGEEGLVSHRGLAFFVAGDGEHGKELWRTNGTESGTYMVKDLVEGQNHASIQNITSAHRDVFFTYSDQSGIYLAKSRGSAVDTVRVAALPNGTGTPTKFTAVNNDIYFTLGRTLYRSNGQVGNLRRIGQFAYSSVASSNVYDYNSSIDAVSTDWPAAMTAFGDYLYFIARKGIHDPLQIWRVSARSNKAEIVTPRFQAHALSGNDVGFKVHQDRLFLTVFDRLNNEGGIFELRTGGKTNQWVRHTAMSAKELSITGNKMYFAGLDDQYGDEPRVLPLPKRP